MSGSRWISRALAVGALVLAAAVSGCLVPVPMAMPTAGVASSGELPSYGRGRLVQDGVNESRAIRYRELTRADFQAAEPRRDMARHARHIGAYTCLVFPRPSFGEVDLAHDPSAGVFVARIPEPIFYAAMDPGCSWWNPAQDGQPPDYILEHEQIHFMLAEIEARRTATAVRALEGRGASHEAAVADLGRQLGAARDALTSDLMAVSDEFDRDTSAKYVPGLQSKWRRLAELKLARLPASAEEPMRASGEAPGHLEDPATPAAAERTWQPL